MARSGRTGTAPNVGRQKERLRAAIEPVLAAAQYDLEDLVVSRAGNRSVVRVVVDSDQGVDSDVIADLSRDISVGLDEAEAADGPLTSRGYTLEVSSPGIDRPLTQPRHWRRNRGRLVTVRVGPTTRTGRVLAADDNGVRLDVAGEVHDLTYAELGPGKVQIEFGRPGPLESGEDGREDAPESGEEEP
jgi:ribosome maturation factor RimP